MLKNDKITLFIAMLIGSLCCWACKDDPCVTTEVPVEQSAITWAHLDTRPATNRVLAPGEEGLKNAYGLRLSTSTAYQNPADSLLEGCLLYTLTPRANAVEIMTLTGMGPLFPPGAVVNSEFKYASGGGLSDLSGLGPFLTILWSTPNITAFCDLILTSPPAEEGWQQFRVRVDFQDGSTQTITTDSVFLAK